MYCMFRNFTLKCIACFCQITIHQSAFVCHYPSATHPVGCNSILFLGLPCLRAYVRLGYSILRAALCQLIGFEYYEYAWNWIA